MTPAITLLKKKKVHHEVLKYAHDADSASYGLEAVEKLKELIPSDFTLTDLALKWILMHPEVSVVIPGAKNKLQASNNVKASDLNDIDSLMSKINSIYDEMIKEDIHHRW